MLSAKANINNRFAIISMNGRKAEGILSPEKGRDKGFCCEWKEGRRGFVAGGRKE
jgi:hypothetical protein